MCLKLSFFLNANIWHFQCKKVNKQYVFAQRPHTVNVEVWERTGRFSTYIYLIESVSRVIWAYFRLTVLCIHWLNISCLKYMFWSSRAFQSTCEELALLRYSLRFGLQTLLSSSIIFGIVGSSVSSSSPKSCKPRPNCSATKVWQVDFRISLWLWRSRSSFRIT